MGWGRVVGRGIAAHVLALGLVGCAAEPRLPDLTAIYAKVAEAGGDAARRPLITIPGTLGSRLRDSATGTVVWGGGSRGLSADPEDPAEARLIALPVLAPGAPFAALRDGVEADGVLDRATPEVLGIPLDIEVYGGVTRTLTAGGFRTGPARRSRLLANLRHGGSGAEQVPPEPPRPPAAAAAAGDAAADDASGDAGAGAVPLAAVAPGRAEALGDAALAAQAEAQVNAFRFDYDWRRDLPTLAAEFHDFVMLRRRQVAEARSRLEGRQVGPDEVTFDLLAHSMGGLVARYYLMHGPAPLPEDGSLPPITWEGARHFNRAIIVATPHAGSILAVDNLVNGKSLGPLQPFYPPVLLATHASVWQLFPRARHRRLREAGPGGRVLDPLDPSLWERHRWGLLDPAGEELRAWLMPEIADPAERLERAAAHQARLMRRAVQFQKAMDRWGPKPERLEVFLVVGGGFATPASAEVDPVTGALAITGREEGDGVVLRASVLLDERQGLAEAGGLVTPLRFDSILFLPDEHVELTKNPVFGDNLLFWLLEQPREAEGLAEPKPGVFGGGGGRPQPVPAAAALASGAGAER
ncbi:hypothetical protein LNKW23_20270 [Paralimibaculum aggregatum]|uniref:Alpha/beta hydrolase n=1 Tax=Paralimibaculum aggregatum TaxID=3036245 RepID=A0ABQ6LPX6_9RHOB|nr:hypothetical protein [Limibaculum sp. NKW23]GMG82814.1 hypothetical protein LNKW23_20270 [Limibaculum sp. NKW23]